jgi:hypothetical protein
LPLEGGILRSRVDGATRIALGVDDALGRLIRVAEARGARTRCENADADGRACGEYLTSRSLHLGSPNCLWVHRLSVTAIVYGFTGSFIMAGMQRWLIVVAAFIWIAQIITFESHNTRCILIPFVQDEGS